uniref:G_PROTEIN_RECEP_F1_2 domain-containing protein n=1 Tax=Steinernema glaseri TaxID=37863 RepID=A0A1I7YFL5_9BILA
MAFLLRPQDYFVVLNTFCVVLILLTALTFFTIYVYTPTHHRHIAYCLYNVLTWFTLSALWVALIDRSNHDLISTISMVCSISHPVFALPIPSWLKRCISSSIQYNGHAAVIVMLIYVCFGSYLATRKRQVSFLFFCASSHVLISVIFGLIDYKDVFSLATANATVLVNNGYNAATTRCTQTSGMKWTTVVVITYSLFVVTFLISAIVVQSCKKIKSSRRAALLSFTLLIGNVVIFSTVPLLVSTGALLLGNEPILLFMTRITELLRCAKAIGSAIVVLFSVSEYRRNILDWIPKSPTKPIPIGGSDEADRTPSPMFFNKTDAELLMRNLGLKPSVSVEEGPTSPTLDFGSPKTVIGIPIARRSFQNSSESLGGSLKSYRSRPFSPLPQIEKMPPHHGHFQEMFRSRAATTDPMYPLRATNSTDMFLHRLDQRHPKLFFEGEEADGDSDFDRLKLGHRVMSLEFPPLKASAYPMMGVHKPFRVKSQTLSRRPHTFETSSLIAVKA